MAEDTEYTLDDIDQRLDVLIASLDSMAIRELDQNATQSILWD